jgi:threonine aldolase
MIDRLADDHANARRLAEALAKSPGIRGPGDIAQPDDGPLDPARVQTNFVLFRVDSDRRAFLAAAASHGLLLESYPHGQIRAATHYGVSASDVDRAATIIAAAIRESSPAVVGAGSGRR